MDLLKNYFQSINDLYTKPHELAAIWIEQPVQTSEGFTIRIAPEMYIRVEDGKIAKSGEYTHKVIGCYGTLIDQFEIACTDIVTGEPTIIKL